MTSLRDMWTLSEAPSIPLLPSSIRKTGRGPTTINNLINRALHRSTGEEAPEVNLKSIAERQEKAVTCQLHNNAFKPHRGNINWEDANVPDVGGGYDDFQPRLRQCVPSGSSVGGDVVKPGRCINVRKGIDVSTPNEADKSYMWAPREDSSFPFVTSSMREKRPFGTTPFADLLKKGASPGMVGESFQSRRFTNLGVPSGSRKGSYIPTPNGSTPQIPTAPQTSFSVRRDTLLGPPPPATGGGLKRNMTRKRQDDEAEDDDEKGGVDDDEEHPNPNPEPKP